MPVYQIHLHRRDGSVETITLDLDDQDQLRLAMAGFAAQLLKEPSGTPCAVEEWRVEGTDAAGRFLYEVRASTQFTTAATKH